jgi:hypothetical protein
MYTCILYGYILVETRTDPNYIYINVHTYGVQILFFIVEVVLKLHVSYL